MAEITTNQEGMAPANRMKFILGGALIAAAILFLIISSTISTAQYFLTVEELYALGDEAIGRELKVEGVVDGDTIEFDANTLTLRFSVVHIPGDMNEIERMGGLAEAAHQALLDPETLRLPVVIHGPKPDLLQDQAQAIITGQLSLEGIFIGEEVLLKCPTRYESEIPLQVEQE
ncbi:MAG TPA: cytochrome c maturation protein CcmE [Anaerolineae bacterium]|nr:cytochrome c maturation protein CcmE [Anaerolineae bacterium]